MTVPSEARPAVAVVLCVRNGGELLEAQLAALAHQRIDVAWELVVVDNGSTDDSLRRVQRSAHLFPQLTVVDAHDRAGLSYARNVGSAAARAEVIAYCDADDVVRPEWLANLYRAVAPGRMAGGGLDFAALNDETVRFWRGLGTSMDELPVWFDYAPSVMGANFAITRADLEKLGGFDELFTGSSDEVDLCYRAHQNGVDVVFAENAVVAYRLRETIRETARQQRAYGEANTLLYRKHRDHVPKPTLRTTVVPYLQLARAVTRLVRGRRLRGSWLNHAAYRWGRLTGSIRARVWFV